VAAAWLLRTHVPDLRVRVVNVVDLMTLFPRDVHPHGMDELDFTELFTAEKPVIFAFHGYERAIHAIIHGRTGAERFHVRGFNEEGTTTTPFDLVVVNGMSRFHLCKEVIRRCRRSIPNADALIRQCDRQLARHRDRVREHLDDMPEVRDWTWTQ
jgi:xylulose-5-phosphate/fructose-6-phosphate phosphoketolase